MATETTRYDAVAAMRKARDKLSRRFKGMTFAEQKPKGWWEYCTIWSKRLAWAYTSDSDYRPTAEVIAELRKRRMSEGQPTAGDRPDAADTAVEAAAEGRVTPAPPP